MKKLVIFGAGGLAREVLWVARDINSECETYDILGFIDDNPDFSNKRLSDLPVLGGFEWLENNFSSEILGVCGIGNTVIRRKIAERANAIGLKFATLIHPSVMYSKYVEIGEGVVICAGNIITTQIELHDHIFLNLGCTVGHDAILEKYVNCAPSCNISGDVTLEEGAHLGTGVQVIQGLRIGKYTTVGAGAVVIKNLPPYSVAVGMPAIVKKKKEPPFND